MWNMVDEGAAGEAVARARLILALLAEERLTEVARPCVLRRQRPLIDAVKEPVDVAYALDQAGQHARDEDYAEAAHLRLILAAHRRLGADSRLRRRRPQQAPLEMSGSAMGSAHSFCSTTADR